MPVEVFGKRFVRKVGKRYSLVEKPDGDCTFFERESEAGAGGCTVYPVRPWQCRTFPFWPENIASRRAWEEVGEECPGLNRGRTYSLEDIRKVRQGENDAAGK